MVRQGESCVAQMLLDMKLMICSLLLENMFLRVSNGVEFSKSNISQLPEISGTSYAVI